MGMKKYDNEFKKQVIAKYLGGESIAALSRETGVSETVLHKWKVAMVTKGDGEPDKEKLEMRKRIIELEMENDILKKAAVIFSRPG